MSSQFLQFPAFSDDLVSLVTPCGNPMKLIRDGDRRLREIYQTGTDEVTDVLHIHYALEYSTRPHPTEIHQTEIYEQWMVDEVFIEDPRLLCLYENDERTEEQHATLLDRLTSLGVYETTLALLFDARGHNRTFSTPPTERQSNDQLWYWRRSLTLLPNPEVFHEVFYFGPSILQEHYTRNDQSLIIRRSTDGQVVQVRFSNRLYQALYDAPFRTPEERQALHLYLAVFGIRKDLFSEIWKKIGTLYLT